MQQLSDLVWLLTCSQEWKFFLDLVSRLMSESICTCSVAISSQAQYITHVNVLDKTSEGTLTGVAI